RHWYRPGLPFRRLELLASGEREADAICSEYLNVIARRGQESAVANALVRALVEGRLGGWDELMIPLMDGDGPIAELLAAAARRAGLWAEILPKTRAPHIPLPGTWDDYLRAVGPKSRSLINRSLRDFDRWAEGTARLEQASTPESLRQGKRILQELH